MRRSKWLRRLGVLRLPPIWPSCDGWPKCSTFPARPAKSGPQAASDGERRYLAIGLTVAGISCFVLENVAVHRLQTAGAIPLTVIRSLGGLVLVLILSGGRPSWRISDPGLYTLRCSAAVTSVLCSMLAYRSLPVANVAAISFSQSFFLAIYGLWLGEPVGIRRWLLIAIGFAGALIIVRPVADELQLYYLAALASAATNAAALAASRRIGRDDEQSTLTQLLWISATGAVLGFAADEWPVPSPWLLGVFVCGPIGMLCGIAAVRHAPLAVLAPYRYLRLPLAAVLAFLVFGEMPDGITILGSALILGVCLMMGLA